MNELFRNVLTASFHGSIVIGAVMLIRPFLKKTPKKFLCLLWMLAFLRLLMPFEIRSELSLQPEIASVTEMRMEETGGENAEFAPVVPEAVPEQEPVLEEHLDPLPQTVGSVPQENVGQSAQTLVTDPGTVGEKPFDWGAAVATVWAVVAGCFGIYTAVTYFYMKRKVRFAVKIPGGWECDNIDTAFILGFIKPNIYIPMGMPQIVRKHVLAHERTHLEKGDHWIKMMGFIALAVDWFNPLVWAAYILLCKDI